MDKDKATKVNGFSVRCLRDAGVGGPTGDNETAGTTPSAPGGDNACCSELGARLDSLEHVISSQDSTINALNEQVEDLLPFECGKSKLKDAEGNKYNTVAIGNQCWMAQNLRTNVDGSVYPKKNGQVELSEAEKVTCGRLYTWNVMMKGAPSTNYLAGTTEADTIVHGICPAGWHVPSNAEFDTLTRYVYNSTDPDYKCSSCLSSDWEQSTKCIANALSAATGWNNSSTSGCNAGDANEKRNLTGFSAVPAGNCFDGDFDVFGSYAYFWSATQYGGDYAWCRCLGSSVSIVYSFSVLKDNGFSVRCLRD